VVSGKLVFGIFELVIDPLQRLYPETQRAFLQAVVPLYHYLPRRPYEAIGVVESVNDLA
jgi:hypothetical protein